MSKASSQRSKRRQLTKDIQLECGECGRKMKPSRVRDIDGEAYLYSAECSCGAHIQGVLGSGEFVSFYHSFMSGYLAGMGHEPPMVDLRALPAGWHDRDLH